MPIRRTYTLGLIALMSALTLALMPAYAASQSTLRLPVEPFIWAGLLGLVIGADGAATSVRPGIVRIARVGVHALVWVIGLLLLIAAVGAALPPFALIQQDLEGLLNQARQASIPPLPTSVPELVTQRFTPRTPAFVASATARLLNELADAPTSGQSGARLLLATLGIMVSWLGALLLGRVLITGHQLLIATVPMLFAVALLAIPGGAGGLPLIFAIFAAVWFASSAGFAQREQNWEQRGIDYSDELRRDGILWSGLLILVALLVGWIVPFWPGNPISQAFEQLNGIPSGVAALNQGLDRSGARPTVDIGVSTLPSLDLGRSIAQGPPTQPALRIRTNLPLNQQAGIQYWRVRVFNAYIGSSWSADARNSQEQASDTDLLFEGAIVQQIEDLRPDKQLIVAQPDIVAISIPARYERFEDGAVAAVAGTPPEIRYTVVSRPPALAPLAPPDKREPNLVPYLGLPESLPARVRELGQAITGTQTSVYGRALAIEAYLRELPYSYEVQPLPGNGDAVDQFLFDMRSGYCTYYASAMAILARSQGIPARVVVGYVSGEQQPDGSYLVRESDAHAWPELLINERWVAFEPTPIRPLPARGAAVPAETITLPEAAPAPAFPWLLVLVALGLLGVSLGWLGWRRWQPGLALNQLDQALLVLERSAARHRIERPAGSTLREFAALLGERVRPLEALASGLALLIERGRYRGRALEPDEQRELQRLREQLEHEPVEQQNK